MRKWLIVLMLLVVLGCADTSRYEGRYKTLLGMRKENPERYNSFICMIRQRVFAEQNYRRFILMEGLEKE